MSRLPLTLAMLLIMFGLDSGVFAARSAAQGPDPIETDVEESIDNEGGSVGIEIGNKGAAGGSSGSGGSSGGGGEDDGRAVDHRAWDAATCNTLAPFQAGFGVEHAVETRLDGSGEILEIHRLLCGRGPDVAAVLISIWAVMVYDPVADATRARDQLLVQLRSTVTVPTPEIAMSPPVDGDQLVGLWAWFWVNPNSYQTQSDTAADPQGLSITLTAEPTVLRFYPGDNEITGQTAAVTCEGPGLIWERGMDDKLSECRHFWDWPSKHAPNGVFVTRAEADYQFTWQATGDLAIHLPTTTGTIGQTTIVSEDTPVTVTEIQAVLG